MFKIVCSDCFVIENIDELQMTLLLFIIYCLSIIYCYLFTPDRPVEGWLWMVLRNGAICLKQWLETSV